MMVADPRCGPGMVSMTRNVDSEDSSGRDGGRRRRTSSEPEGRRPLTDDEVAIDLSDLEDAPRRPAARKRHADPSLRSLLEVRFRGDQRRVADALELYRGRYASLGAYVLTCLESDGVAEWLIRYIDCEAIGLDWAIGGTLWTLPAQGRELHVFLG